MHSNRIEFLHLRVTIKESIAMIEVFGSINLRFFIGQQLKKHLLLYFLFIFHCKRTVNKVLWEKWIPANYFTWCSINFCLPFAAHLKGSFPSPRLYLRSLFLSSSNYHQLFEIISRRSSLAKLEHCRIVKKDSKLKERKAKHSTFSAQSRLIKFTNVEAHIGGSL